MLIPKRGYPYLFLVGLLVILSACSGGTPAPGPGPTATENNLPTAPAQQEPVSQDGVLNFLVRNDRLPRSLTYSLNSIRHGLRALPRHEQSLRRVNSLRRSLKDIEFEDAEQIRQFLDDVQVALAELDQAISRTYFQVRPSRGRSPQTSTKRAAAARQTASK